MYWYHGSTYCCIKSSSDIRFQPFFVTDSDSVAVEYTKILMSSGDTREQQFVVRPVIYVFVLNTNKIFDTRISEHKSLFLDLVNQTKNLDPDDAFRKSDLISVPSYPGSNIGGIFPQWGITIPLMQYLKQYEIEASYIAEGGQGASLAVMNPGKNLSLIETWTL